MSKRLSKFAVAAAIYAALVVYLYQPYFKNFDKLQYLLVANVCIGALGCFLLSQRWVAAFWGSLFAGAIYGFGPFVLGLAKFHPTAGLLAAAVPWLFCPAALYTKAKWRWLSWPLSTLPFLAILLFFQMSIHYRLFAISIQTKLHLADLAGLLAPLVIAERSTTLISFYHIPIAALMMGLSMLIMARRFGIMMILAIGTILAFCDPVLNTSPIIWLAMPVLCCSVLIGAGIQGLVCAGSADRKWVLMSAAIMVVLSLASLLLATKYYQIFAGLGVKHAKLFVQTAKMYILGTMAVAIIFFMARAKLRVAALRWVILCSAMAVDIFLGARIMVDAIF